MTQKKDRLIDRMFFYPILDGLKSNPYSGTIIIAFVVILTGVFFPPSLILFAVLIAYGFYLKSKRKTINQKVEDAPARRGRQIKNK